MHKNR